MATEETFTIEAPDGSTDEVHLPDGLVSVFTEGDESPAAVVGDVVQLGFTQRAHALVHHTEESVDDDIETIEKQALDLFEDRFGQSFEAATGHSH